MALSGNNIIRLIVVTMAVCALCALSFAATGDLTKIGPIFGFGNISTNGIKIKSTRPNDTLFMNGSTGIAVTGTGKRITITGPDLSGYVKQSAIQDVSTSATPKFQGVQIGTYTVYRCKGATNSGILTVDQSICLSGYSTTKLSIN